MSSIHSQSSDTPLSQIHQHPQQLLQQQPLQYRDNDQTPAIKEEEEEDEDEGEGEVEEVQLDKVDDEENSDGQFLGNENILPNGNGTKKLRYMRKKSSRHSSPNSTSSSNSNGNSNKSVSTITFEKQKVPHRARTQSAQSVLSNISLRSLLQSNHQNQQQQLQQQKNGEQDPSSMKNFMDINQQIQSPAMSSVRKKGLTNANGASATSTTYMRSSTENQEIGLQLPFTDDKRLDLETMSANLRLQRQASTSSMFKDVSNSAKKNVTSADNAEVEDDDETLQKRLTTQALRKLSIFKGNGTATRSMHANSDNNLNANLPIVKKQHEGSDGASQPIEKGDPIKRETSYDNDHDDKNNDSNYDDDITMDNFADRTGSMTHLKFGNKKVFLDSSPFQPGMPTYGNTNRNKNFTNVSSSNTIQTQPFLPGRKHSLDVIQQPNRNRAPSATPHMATKRLVKQISNPKKPLYMPAVLRDVSETNITIDDVIRPSSPQHTLLSGNQNINSRNNLPSSSQASVYSNSSSILENCKRRISSFLFSNGDTANLDSMMGPKLEAPVPPTREHWLPDSKRASCHYCHKLFTFLDRKHHCRHCGDIFCQQHLAHWLYLNSSANFIIGGGGMGTLSKICDGCLEEYENLIKNPNWNGQKALTQAAQSDTTNPNLNSSKNRTSANSAAIEVASAGNDADSDKGKADVIGSVVGSVPADWNWSSF